METMAHDIDRLRAGLASPTGGAAWLPQAWEDVRHLRVRLRQLLLVNTAYVRVSLDEFQKDDARTRTGMLGVGISGILLALGLGVLVHRAIAPRIVNLVSSVRRFQQFGVHQPLLEQGHDEIAVLANALDAGFAAIAERSRERERFLAVVAHELKTPMTSIFGFTELALKHPENTALRSRALELVGRHSGRLRRLIDDLLLAASARGGRNFPSTTAHRARLTPRESDRRGRSRHAGAPVRARAARGGARPRRRTPPRPGDSGALTYAVVIAQPDLPIVIRMDWSGSRVRLEDLDGGSDGFREGDRAFFRAVCVRPVRRHRRGSERRWAGPLPRGRPAPWWLDVHEKRVCNRARVGVGPPRVKNHD